MSKLSDYLRTKINNGAEEREISSEWGFYFTSGLAAAARGRHRDARREFRDALKLYKTSGFCKVITSGRVRDCITNIAASITKEHPDDYIEQIRQELQDPLYDGLEDELAAIAMRWPGLAVVIRDRKSPAPVDKRAG
jgi:hypothetical protein